MKQLDWGLRVQSCVSIKLGRSMIIAWQHQPLGCYEFLGTSQRCCCTNHKGRTYLLNVLKGYSYCMYMNRSNMSIVRECIESCAVPSVVKRKMMHSLRQQVYIC